MGYLLLLALAGYALTQWKPKPVDAQAPGPDGSKPPPATADNSNDTGGAEARWNVTFRRGLTVAELDQLVRESNASAVVEAFDGFTATLLLVTPNRDLQSAWGALATHPDVLYIEPAGGF